MSALTQGLNWRVTVPENINHLHNIYTTLAQRLRRWTNIVQMLYKCVVFTGVALVLAGRTHIFHHGDTKNDQLRLKY